LPYLAKKIFPRLLNRTAEMDRFEAFLRISLIVVRVESMISVCSFLIPRSAMSQVTN
jgi:hypothetical protein